MPLNYFCLLAITKTQCWSVYRKRSYEVILVINKNCAPDGHHSPTLKLSSLFSQRNVVNFILFTEVKLKSIRVKCVEQSC
ncbi:CLUMA_CG018399, isoform A [Clunio marinus]|uniref:CLUMA_CG018399, isoform A n=1 Tax=Clunio marinus TaxID=568069 RepID=A0A1J1J446_9DIPT|nr:CLUMA_CG018399, isoform A [Clunio marinus]